MATESLLQRVLNIARGDLGLFGKTPSRFHCATCSCRPRSLREPEGWTPVYCSKHGVVPGVAHTDADADECPMCVEALA